MNPFGPIFRVLNEAEVRYVIVGGLATVLHGHTRLTLDIDLVVDLEPDEAKKAIQALTDFGFESRLPVPAMEFADPSRREQWIREKGMRVFSLWHPEQPLLAVDLFTEHPIDFQNLWNRAQRADLEGERVRIASISDLIELKRAAGRPKDLEDIRRLEQIRHREEPQ